MREVRAMSRAGRRNQILIAFAIQIKNGLGNEMSAYDIARKIDLRPTSPNFRDLLSNMVMDGILKVREVAKEGRSVNGKPRFLYSLVKELEPQKRPVAIRANGKQIGQMELF
jgi:hypothetical protein